MVDCETSNEIVLQLSGKILNKDTVKTPMIAISNYVFNGLHEDAISINNGTVSEAYVKITTDKELFYSLWLMRREEDKSDPDIISRMKVEWSYKPIEKLEEHFQDADLLAIVKE